MYALRAGHLCCRERAHESRCIANVANAIAMLDVLLTAAAWCHCLTHACTAQRPVVHSPQAKAYLTAALRASAPLRIGGGPSRPLNHGYQTADWAAAAGSNGQQQQEGQRVTPARLQLYAVTDAACDARQVGQTYSPWLQQPFVLHDSGRKGLSSVPDFAVTVSKVRC